MARVDELCQALKDLAIEKGPGYKLPTTRELCSTYGTSLSTVNNALNALELQNIVFRRPGSGIFVSSRINEKNISLVIGSHMFQSSGQSPFWNVLWASFIRVAQERAFDRDEAFHIRVGIRLKQDHDHIPQLAELIQDNQVHGVLAVGMDDHNLQLLKAHNVPHVGFAGSGSWQVSLSYDDMVRLGIEALVERGRRRIGVWLPSPAQRPAHEDLGTDLWRQTYARERALVAEICRGLGIPLERSLYRDNRIELRDQPVPLGQDQGYALVHEVFRSTDPPDGLVICDDMMTLGAVTAFREMGIEVGKDIVIATHANSGTTVFYGIEQKLIRLEFDSTDLVREMYSMLDVLMHGDDLEEPFHVVHPHLRA